MPSQPEASRDRLNQVLCALAVVFAVLACRPFVEASFNDDWSYGHITLNFARTGHFAYDGWCTPTLLFQAFWGSLLIKQVGFSFELLRFSTLPFAMGCGILCYRMGRMAGLTSISSLFGSLAFVTSPMFIPLAASFMTEIYGCFFVLLSLYCGACAGGMSLSTRQQALWLSASVLVGYAGGLDRQTGYIAPGAVLLWATWRWRRERVMLAATGCLLVALSAGAYFALQWQSQQPLGSGMIVLITASLRKAAIFPAQLILTLTLLILPAAVRFGTGRWRVPIRFYAISSLCVLGGYTLSQRIAHGLIFPWPGNLMTQFGVLAEQQMRGRRPAVLNHEVRVAITLVVLAVLVPIVALLLHNLWLYRSASRKWEAFSESSAVLQLSAVFAALYAGALQYRQSPVITFDRYFLPLFPLALIAALLMIQRLPGTSLTLANWSLLAIFAVYGVATTHDYFASLGARVAAFQKVQALGVLPRQISGGFELDGWTEAEAAGRVTYTSISTDLTTSSSKLDPIRSGYWFLSYTPDINPLYYLSWSEEPGLRSASLSAVPFETWLPPFGRDVKILIPETKQ